MNPKDVTEGILLPSGIKSAKGMVDPPHIHTGLWHSNDGYFSRAFESSQRVKASG